MTTQQKTFDLLEASGLNWSVVKEPLVPQNSEFFPETRSYGLFNNNTKKHIFTVGEQFTPLQNAEMVELMVEAAESLGLPYEAMRAGSLANGKKIYVQIKVPDVMVARDTIKQQITSLNFHGTGSVGFGTTNTVIICQNTFYMALRDADTKFRHSVNVKQNLENAIKGLLATLQTNETNVENFNRLANAEMKPLHLQQTIGQLFGVKVDIDAPLETAEISSRKKNQILSFADAFKLEIPRHGESLWGLFNAVTYYTNHILNDKKDDTFLVDGGGAKINIKTYDSLMEWIS